MTRAAQFRIEYIVKRRRVCVFECLYIYSVLMVSNETDEETRDLRAVKLRPHIYIYEDVDALNAVVNRNGF